MEIYKESYPIMKKVLIKNLDSKTTLEPFIFVITLFRICSLVSKTTQRNIVHGVEENRAFVFQWLMRN